MHWKDLFSRKSAEYAAYRPSYPEELFAWLADVSPDHQLAVDVGTGTGQAAVGLAAHFGRVIGIEPSTEQLAHATEHERVVYRNARAEVTGLPDETADLVLATQAFHWFRADAFFAEAQRILRPGGMLVLVAYALSDVTPEIDEVVDAFYERLDPYWEPERRLIETGYRTVEVPFHELEAPSIVMHATWSVEQMLGFLGTWSALERARERERADPLAEFAPQLQAAWGDVGPRVVSWPLSVRAFRL